MAAVPVSGVCAKAKVHHSSAFLAECLEAYRDGFFPMADEHGDTQWYRATHPAVIPMDGSLHIPRSLRKVLRKGVFHYRWNGAFSQVVEACADRNITWINDEIKAIYADLHEMGLAHSFECWKDGQLAGGVLGLTLGAAFIGETMCTLVEDGGKCALVTLVETLRRGGFVHFDCQLINEHTARFGAFEMTPVQHMEALTDAVRLSAQRLDPLV